MNVLTAICFGIALLVLDALVAYLWIITWIPANVARYGLPMMVVVNTAMTAIVVLMNAVYIEEVRNGTR